jgi:hypothetical protein
VIGDSIQETARRSREAANAPGSWAEARLGKIGNFLASRPALGILFKKVRQAWLAPAISDA